MNALAGQDTECRIAGLAISPGLATGRAYVHEDILERVLFRHTVNDDQLDDEWSRIQAAIESIDCELVRSASRVERELGRDLAAIFESHRQLLHDPSLHREFGKELQDRRVNAEEVVRSVLARHEVQIRSLESGKLSERGDDIADLSRRLLRVLSGTPEHTITKCPAGSVLIARQLLPSECVHLKRCGIAAVVIERGGATSHAALLTREMGVPAVSGISAATDRITSGNSVLVDGDVGAVVVHAAELTRKEFMTRLRAQNVIRERLRSHCRQPAVTKDGQTIRVMANAGCRPDVQQAVEDGADGIGLFRMEQHFLTKSSLPTRDELFAELREALEPAKGLEVTVRLLDTGGDKRMPWLDLPHEPDPFLGRRGVRFLLAWPELLRAQLQALLRLSREMQLNVLIPMVTRTDEVQRVRSELTLAAAKLNVEPLRLGAMIETPAAALCARQIAQHCDFLSIGTNDLTQYTMVAGRENPLVNDYFDDEHPAVMRLIRMVCMESRCRPVSVCGELAASSVIELLLNLQVRILSVAPPLIPQVKEQVRKVTLTPEYMACNR